jgi:hypothetical protein
MNFISLCLIQFCISSVNLLSYVLTCQNIDINLWHILNINNGASYPLIKNEIKNQLECGETKKTNLVEGKLGQLKYLRGVNQTKGKFRGLSGHRLYFR